jgi:hypothetical protein
MTHEDTGHYSSKHPEGTSYDPALAAALTERAKDGRITCTAAFDLAEAFKVAPSEVGKTTDLIELRIVECQLGLFGYSPEKRIVKPADKVTQGLRGQLGRYAADGRISCASCWEIAHTLGIEKMAVSSACELLRLKIKPCRLGAF